MALVDMLRKYEGGPSSTRGGGLSGMVSRYSQSQDSDLGSRIGNAQTRLVQSGVSLPEEPNDQGGLFSRILDGLNFLNNKKNQLAFLATEGGKWSDVPSEVSGKDLLNRWGMKEEGVGDNIAGFGFDLLTDPLNLLSFGTLGAANQAVKGGAKGLNALNDVKLLGDGVAGASVKETKAPIFAQLGGHIPFTDIGGYVNIPGSDKVLGAARDTISKGTGRLTRMISEKAPGLAKIGEGVKDTLGQTFIRGYGAPAAVNQITSRTQDLIRMDNQDIVNQVIGYHNDWKKAGYNPATDDLEIIKAIEDPVKLQSLTPVQQGVAEQVKQFFDFHFLKARDAGVVEDFTANYIPHIFKGPRQEVEAALEQIRRRGVRIPTSSPFGNERTIQMNLAHILSDPELTKRLKPETNLVKIMGTYKASLEKAIRNQDMLEDLVALGPETILKESEEVFDAPTNTWTRQANDIPKGWVKAPVTQLKGYWVPPDVARHLKDVMEPFFNNRSFDKIMKTYDGVLGWWKGMATVPNLGFHIRNGMGNIFNNYLAGVRSVDNYKLALQAQKAQDTTMDDFFDMQQLFNDRGEFFGEGISLPSVDVSTGLGPRLEATGLEERDGIMELMFNRQRMKARFFEGDGPKIKVKWGKEFHEVNMAGIKFLAKIWGITGRGYFGADLGEDILKQLQPRTTFQKFNPLSTQSTLFKGLEKGGNLLDDNTRIAHFISKLKGGMSLEESARSVKKYLFDYAQLAPSEKNFFRRLMPFYAFTRNNLPLQLQELVKQPKYAAVMGKFQNFMNEMSEDVTGVEVDQDTLPKYLKNLYSVRLPFQVGREDRDVMLGIDLPIRDINSLSFREGMSMLTPLLTFPFEQLANRNMYSGRDLEAFEGQTVRAPGYMQGIFKGLTSLSDEDPRVTKFGQIMNTLGLTVAVNEETGGFELRMPPRFTHLLDQLVAAKNVGKLGDSLSGQAYDPFASSSFLTGVGAVSSSLPQRNLTSQYQQLQALEDLLRKLRDEGTPVPTLQELSQGGGLNGRR